MFEFHVSRLCRDKYNFDQTLFGFDGNVIFSNFLAAREFAQKINLKRDLMNFPEQAVRAGDINALGLIDEILHVVISLYRQTVDPNVMAEAYLELKKTLGEKELDQTLHRFTQEFPPLAVYRGEITTERYLQAKTDGTPNKHLVLEELLLLWITNKNPAISSFNELFDDASLSQATAYRQIITGLGNYFTHKPYFGPDNQDLVTMLRSPAIAEPNSLIGQLEYIRRKWGALLGDYLYRLLSSIDLITEETKAIFSGPSPTQILSFDVLEEEENFSPDSDWMPRTVMLAKNTYVWLYQLSETYQRDIRQLDQIPEEELDKLAAWGFNGLWLIGLWERSDASKRIKQLCGNPEAVASAYSLKNYEIADALGGEDAYQTLRDRAWQRGIRLASDMVPNHMGIDSDWVIDHPDWFISLPYSPFPSYSFSGPDLSPVDRVGIYIEDHYYDRTDAAVVFMRVNRYNGETRFIYHGNDGTSMPWNDTAQLDYLNAEVREAVVQTILNVARKFPIIRFDAAMTLAKKHYQRLWFPQPGSGGAIPSRAEHGLTKDGFDQVFPKEFWREVVDRIAQEVPDTLLLAEAFWLMEGYFVRTLGMHRVYNSAFMNMLRNEENSKYRMVIKNTLEFDPEILKRYVNFMNNPDEKTAVDQFGKGDKYFGICMMMSTMPGLPMFGHGQIEGFAEKYGMEYFRPYWDEDPDHYLIDRHQRDIFPLLKRRDLFAGIDHFLLYDFYTGDNQVNEDVFAYTNGSGSARALVIYHNHFGSTKGWIHTSCSYLNKETGNLEQKLLYNGLNIRGETNYYVIFRDSSSNLEYIRSSEEIKLRGLYFELNAYEHHVYVDFREVQDNAYGQYAQLNQYLNGRGVPSVDEALKELMLAPILNPMRAVINKASLDSLYNTRLTAPNEKLDIDIINIHYEKFTHLMESINGFTQAGADIRPITREENRGLDATLKLNVFQEHFPFPGSQKYKDILGFIQSGLTTEVWVWYVLILWNDLRLLGRVITSEAQFAEVSRSWFEEWGIQRMVRSELESLGWDSNSVYRSETVLKMLIRQQNWIRTAPEMSAYGLIKTWFSEEEIRSFLNINRYRDKLWFNQEAFEEMMWWMMTVALIQLISDPVMSLPEMVERLFSAYELISEIVTAEEDSEFQVEKLLEGLK
jgi:glycosidase